MMSVTVQLSTSYHLHALLFLLFYLVQWKQHCMYYNSRALSKKTQIQHVTAHSDGKEEGSQMLNVAFNGKKKYDFTLPPTMFYLRGK